MSQRNKAVISEIFGERFDANYTLFLDQQLEAMEAELYRVVYQDLKARDYLPLKTDVNAGAETFAYRVLDMFGRADFVSNYSDELPRVGLRSEKKVGRIETIAAAFGYSKQDLRAAAMNNTPLDAELARAALRAIEEKLNTTALLGNDLLGFVGFFKHPDVAVLSASDWDNPATTGVTMLANLRALLNKVLEQSAGVFAATNIILPLTTYNIANSKPVDTAGSVQDTVLQVFLRGAAPAVTVSWDVNLETAGVGSTKRAVAFQKDPRVAQLVIPMEVEIGEAQPQNLSFTRPVDMRFGGAVVRQPLALAYSDGF
jgi:hypothetical protein